MRVKLHQNNYFKGINRSIEILLTERTMASAGTAFPERDMLESDSWVLVD